MPAPILATKLFVPPFRPGLVSRPHLVELLNKGLTLGNKLTLLSAPAGFGKTTLLSEWISALPRPLGDEFGLKVSWLSLDEADSDLPRFLTYLVSALRTVVPNFGEVLLTALQSAQPYPAENLLTSLLNEISTLQGRFILVLDDYHLLDSPAVDDALAFLLDHIPPQLYLVLASREDPNLPLPRMRSRGQLTELRAHDLRFTLAETAEFLNRMMGLDLTLKDVEALEARTEGWVAGLQMAALSMQGQSDIASFIQSFTGSHRFVLDYLLEEVINQQPPDIQNFLLCTSLLNRLSGPLCDAVLGNPFQPSTLTLESLERANLFLIPLDNERRWFRYHHLFAELLRKQLGHSLTAGEIAGLHNRASEWYEHNHLVFDAFHHATEANDVDRAERLMDNQAIGLHFRSVASAILDWLASLPKATLDAHPRLWVSSATLALMTGQTTGVEENLQAAEKALQKNGLVPLEGDMLDEKIRDLLGQIACARATLALTRYDPPAMVTQAHLALKYLHPDNLAFRFTANWALTTALMFQGERAEALEACLEGLTISEKSGDGFSKILALINLGKLQEWNNQLCQAAETYWLVLRLTGDHPQPNAGEIHLGLAKIYYEWNDLDAAELHGLQSLELTLQYDHMIDRFINSKVFLARLKLVQGDVDGAAILLAETEQSARQMNFILRLPEIAAVQVVVLLRQGYLDAAANLAQAHDLTISRARVFLAQGNAAAALAVLEPLRQQLVAKNWQDEWLKGVILQAVTLHMHGDTDKAFYLLGEALAVAKPGGFIRTFIDEGPRMAQLLFEAAAHGIMPDYIGKILDAFESDEPSEEYPDLSPVQPTTELLSERELEVLRLIAEGLSNQEICERLFLALDTVKGHNRRIFHKLRVQRRTEAIARARELGLL